MISRVEPFNRYFVPLIIMFCIPTINISNSSFLIRHHFTPFVLKSCDYTGATLIQNHSRTLMPLSLSFIILILHSLTLHLVQTGRLLRLVAQDHAKLRTKVKTLLCIYDKLQNLQHYFSTYMLIIELWMEFDFKLRNLSQTLAHY